MAAPATSGKISLQFGWQGPNTWRGGSLRGGLDVRVVELVFKHAVTEVSVNIRDGIPSSGIQTLSFTCRKYHESESEFRGRNVRTLAKETHPECLNVTAEQIYNLTIRAGIFEESSSRGPAVMDHEGNITRETRLLRSDREVPLEVPAELEMGGTYRLLVTSNESLSLSARLYKEKKEEKTKTDKTSTTTADERQRRIRAMGEVLVAEGMRNLAAAQQGGFDSTTTPADVFAHIIRGIMRAGQELHPGLKVPEAAVLAESPADLDRLSTDVLQSRFNEAFKKDKECEAQLKRAAKAGDIDALGEHTQAMLPNAQKLVLLGEALERRGIRVKLF